MPKNNILVTGLPGVGKTTLIKRLSEELKDFHPAGFYTAEIRERGIRKGFELIDIDGGKRILSHVDIKSPYMVSKYKVDVEGFENFLDSISLLDLKTNLIIIDEIGKMECLSDKFRKLIIQLLESEKLVIATIAFRGGGVMEEIKKRPDVKLFEITLNNRESLLSEVFKDVEKLLSIQLS